MTSFKARNRRGAALAGAALGTAAGIVTAALVPVPAEYQDMFLYACVAVLSFSLAALFMRLTKTL